MGHLGWVPEEAHSAVDHNSPIDKRKKWRNVKEREKEDQGTEKPCRAK